MRYSIQKVSKDSNGVIQEVFTRTETRKEILTVEEVINRVNNNDEFYVDSAKVRVVKNHITTSADKKKSNNLDSLPSITIFNRIHVYFVNLFNC